LFDIWCISNWNWKNASIVVVSRSEFRIHITKRVFVFACPFVPMNNSIRGKRCQVSKISAKYVKCKTHLLQEFFFAFLASFKDRMFLLYYYVYVIQ
jgi:hypothetical protein